MSRNAEKARGTLNRWRTMGNTADLEQPAHAGSSSSSKRLASDCTSLKECEARRAQLASTIETKMDEIGKRNIHTEREREGVRQLNDEINKLLYIKHQWESQIRRLGGPDYRRGGRGDYAYFGAARELAEVKQFFAEERQISLVKLVQQEREEGQAEVWDGHHTPFELSPEYYGMVDNADELARLEAQFALDQATTTTSAGENVTIEGESIHWDESWKTPTQQDVEQSLLEFKKQQLLRKYNL